mmetsp:Transcript_37818/g.100491  ORF Transcript_37818/g.100491 Transcript_37818/m.100491 type:complete len:377 (+) Transcript_37818:5726-6856(+)
MGPDSRVLLPAADDHVAGGDRVPVNHEHNLVVNLDVDTHHKTRCRGAGHVNESVKQGHIAPQRRGQRRTNTQRLPFERGTLARSVVRCDQGPFLIAGSRRESDVLERQRRVVRRGERGEVHPLGSQRAIRTGRLHRAHRREPLWSAELASHARQRGRRNADPKLDQHDITRAHDAPRAAVGPIVTPAGSQPSDGEAKVGGVMQGDGGPPARARARGDEHHVAHKTGRRPRSSEADNKLAENRHNRSQRVDHLGGRSLGTRDCEDVGGADRRDLHHLLLNLDVHVGRHPKPTHVGRAQGRDRVGECHGRREMRDVRGPDDGAVRDGGCGLPVQAEPLHQPELLISHARAARGSVEPGGRVHADAAIAALVGGRGGRA